MLLSTRSSTLLDMRGRLRTQRMAFPRKFQRLTVKSSDQNSSSPINNSDAISRRQGLEMQMQVALAIEDYGLASQLKGLIEKLNDQDLGFLLARQLQEAVNEERYEDAASIKADLQQHRMIQSYISPAEIDLIPTHSETKTSGIRVNVNSIHMASSSVPSRSMFAFVYRVAITNESNRIIQLRRRHWVICDEKNVKDEINGVGVVGVQPILLPGRSFEYKSGCSLRSPRGVKEGSYTFAVLDENVGCFQETVEVPVSRFKLTTEVGAVV